jgi:hypothetical protein
MRPVTSRLEAVIATRPIVNVAPMYAVGIPPSDIDPVWDEIRVDAGGMMISRAYDPGEDIDTGAPIPYVTISGEQYVTMTGDPYVTVVE